MSEHTDDLEQTLVLAAAAADSLQYEENPDEGKSVEQLEPNDNFHYYTEDSKVDSDVEGHHSKSKRIKLRERDEPQTSSYFHKQTSTPQYNEFDERGSNEHYKSSEDGDTSRDGRNRGVKRRYDHVDSIDEARNSSYSHTQVVATHYNRLEEKGLQERYKSRIIYMRNFHNWIKSMLINEYLTKIKDSKKQHNPPIRVHDMCCGKGGDLSKWKKGNITHLICSDIAEVSLEHCKARYDEMKQRAQRERGGGNMFSIEIIPGDSTKIRLREKYVDPSLKLDLVSCQFAFHYSFESLPQAEGMLRNAAECLQPGGYFIGTIPDSNEIIARARKSHTASFGNNIVNVSLDFDINNPPLFGAKYNFNLDGAVNCPEFLVHFPTLVKLAKKFGLKFVRKEKFLNFFKRMKDDGRQLLINMRSLESYPPNESATLLGDSEDYFHAKEYLKKYEKDNNQIKIGTLSRSEWEASSLYLTFAFVKVKNTWNADGTPHYDIE